MCHVLYVINILARTLFVLVTVGRLALVAGTPLAHSRLPSPVSLVPLNSEHPFSLTLGAEVPRATKIFGNGQ